MPKRIDLRVRLYLALSAVGVISVVGGVAMIWYTFQTQHLLARLVQRHLAAYQAAEAMETALVKQKGFVTYFFLDGNPEWLRQLDHFRDVFNARLETVKQLAQTSGEQEAIDRIEKQYHDYILGKDEVIALYKSGRRDAGADLHRTVRDKFDAILVLCDQYKRLHNESIHQVQSLNDQESRRLRYTALAAVTLSGILVIALSLILSRQILKPLNLLLATLSDREQTDRQGNVVSALRTSVQGLIQDAGQIQHELEKSREHLVHAEKLALVGKLAAGMAHSIRNPFTSVKMRLFSLGRSLKLSAAQQEDFDVISQEIRHIDTIVQNFLEFSRPPKLKMQTVQLTAIVDTTLQLLSHRLKSYNVHAGVERDHPLPKIMADPEQIKEVLVNIIINACEAMADGGHVRIEETIVADSGPPNVCLTITDSGPGIAPDVLDKIFHPFFTTKTDGTGLGLSIAKRIMDDHGGTLEAVSAGVGARFVLAFPSTDGESL